MTHCDTRHVFSRFFLSTTLGAAHLTIGLLSLAIPVWTAVNIFGLAPGRSVPIATRVGGSRDALLGGWLLFFSNASERRRLSAILAAINVIDSISAIVCFSEGNLPLCAMKGAAVASGCLAALAVLAWRL